ncbi:hypothetical protein ABKN59_008255 [Abortiporus biennis]
MVINLCEVLSSLEMLPISRLHSRTRLDSTSCTVVKYYLTHPRRPWKPVLNSGVKCLLEVDSLLSAQPWIVCNFCQAQIFISRYVFNTFTNHWRAGRAASTTKTVRFWASNDKSGHVIKTRSQLHSGQVLAFGWFGRTSWDTH